jgi:hypothetical protein
MSASVSFPLRYVLPTTALSLGATLRLVVAVDAQGGHLEPEVAVSLSAPWHPAPLMSVRCVQSPQGGPLSGTLPAATVPGSLRRAFDRAHPRTAALIADLSARAEQYLAGLRMGEESSQVVTFGQALEVVHRELSVADRVRREWTSRQGRDLRSAEWDLSGGDLVSLDGSPSTLPGDTAIPAGRAREIARDYGLLVALYSDDADDDQRRREASAGVAVYRRMPDGIPDHPAADDASEWVRDDVLSRLWLADANDPVAEIPQQRRAEQPLRMAAPVFGGAGSADPLLEAAVRAAHTQLELLNASDEYSRLASTQFRAEEIAALQHEMRLAYLPRQRSGD